MQLINARLRQNQYSFPAVEQLLWTSNLPGCWQWEASVPDCLPMVLQGWLSQTFHTLQKVQLTLVLFVPERDYKLILASSCYFWCAVLELLRHN